MLGHSFISILVIISRFYTGSETHVGIKIVQTLAINLQTNANKTVKPHLKLVVKMYPSTEEVKITYLF